MLRSTYERLDKDMEIWFVSKNTIYNALNITNYQPHIYEEKLKKVHKNYFHARSIEDPHISGETLSNEIYEIFGLKVSRTTINNYRNEIMKFRQPIRSVHISVQAATERYLFTNNPRRLGKLDVAYNQRAC